jgi:hypothetical protein
VRARRFRRLLDCRCVSEHREPDGPSLHHERFLKLVDSDEDGENIREIEIQIKR